MTSPKTMAAILVASTLGLASIATAAANDAGEGGNSRGTAPERTDEKRGQRKDDDRTTDTERLNAGEQQTAGDARQRDTGNDSRAETTRQYQENRERETASRRQGRDERRQTANLPARSRDRGNFRHTGADRREATSRERRFTDKGRYARDDRHSLHEATNRSRDRVQRGQRNGRAVGSYADHGRAKQHKFDSRVDRRISNQRARIHEGRKSGELSRKEFKRLRGDQKKIARMDNRFGSDGRYTKGERRKLNKALNRSSKRVYRAKHNDRVARKTGSRNRKW